MAWWQLTNRASGERQVVASLGGIDPAQWGAVKLPREPGEHDELIGGKLVLNAARAAAAEAQALHARVSTAELSARVAEIEAKLAATGKE